MLNADANKAEIQPSEMLRLNTSVPSSKDPNRLGVLGGDLQGFPNGRRLTDDVIDISVQAVEGAAQSGQLVDALATGDKVDANDVDFGTEFPYVALPSAVTAADGLGAGAQAAAPQAGVTGSSDTTGGSSNESGSTEAGVAPAANSTTWDDPVPMALAGGAGLALFGGLGAMWFRRRQAAGRADREAGR